jgi:mitochondrial fission protein ELM1
MVTEAAGTGKPVYVQRLKGSSTQLARFHELTRERRRDAPLRRQTRELDLCADQRY